MLITTNLSVSGPLSLSSVSSTTTSLSAMILESGLVKSRILGSMSLKGDNEYLPQISLSFPNIFNLNTSILNFTNQSLTVSLTNQTAKTFFAAPNGLSGTPSFRSIVASDIPTLNQNTTGNAATATALQTARTLTIGNTDKTFDGTSDVSWSLSEIGAQSILTNPITGTGTTNFLSKFTASGTIGDSQIFDNGTNVGIGTTSPRARLDVKAQGDLSNNLVFRVRNSVDTKNFLVVNGAGDVYNNGAGGVATNTFFGENVGRNTTGSSNTAFGISSLQSNTIGTYNIAIGREAGRRISNFSDQTIANNSIFIGYDTRALNDNETNQIVIGHQAIGLGSNSVVLGNSLITITQLRGQVIMGSFTSAPTGIEGAIYYNTTDKKYYGFNGITWNALNLTSHSELTLDDGTNPHGTTKNDVGLGNVDNTSDINKPISTETQSALDNKIDKFIQVTSITISSSGWTLNAGFYEYTYSNVNITSNSIVDVVPDNSAYSIVTTAQLLPRVDSSSGAIKLYSNNTPSGDFGVTIIINKN